MSLKRTKSKTEGQSCPKKSPASLCVLLSFVSVEMSTSIRPWVVNAAHNQKENCFSKALAKRNKNIWWESRYKTLIWQYNVETETDYTFLFVTASETDRLYICTVCCESIGFLRRDVSVVQLKWKWNSLSWTKKRRWTACRPTEKPVPLPTADLTGPWDTALMTTPHCAHSATNRVTTWRPPCVTLKTWKTDSKEFNVSHSNTVHKNN